MTVASSISRVQYNCSGGSTYAFTFGVSQTSEIKVILTDSNGTETTLTETTHYTISATNNDYSSGGTVTTVSSYAAGNTITILRNVPLTQESDYTEGMRTLYESFESGLDKLTRITQQLDEELGRSAKLPMSTTITDLELPLPESNKLLGWNSLETALENKSTTVTTTTLGATYVSYLSNYADFATAISTIGSTVTVLVIDTSAAVSTDLTVPSTLSIVNTKIGGFVIATAKTLTINGVFAGHNGQNFNCQGTGKVVFGSDSVLHVIPEWWGAKGDGLTDDRAAIQLAIDSITTGVVKFGSKTYIMDIVLLNTYYRCLSIKSGITFRGDGVGKTTLKVKNSAGAYIGIFAPNTIGATVNDFSIFDMTVDQNTTNNTLADFPITDDTGRAIIYIGGSSVGMTLERVRFNDISGIASIVGTDKVIIRDCEFLGVGNDGTTHDHSTIYLNGDDNLIVNNIFKGYALSALGAITAIETHGSRTVVTGNAISNYYQGMNITGVALTDSSGITVSDNIMDGVKSGITLWSQTYSTHTTGYGITDIDIVGNTIKIKQNEWSGVNESSSGIRVQGPTADLPIRNCNIIGNSIYYDLETNAARLHSVITPGIGWISPVSVTTAGIENWNVSNNTIVNCPVNALNFSTKISGLIMNNNLIINPGSSLNPAITGIYKTGLLMYPLHADHDITGVEFNNNFIHDNIDTTQMYAGVYLYNGTAATTTQIRMMDNTIIKTGGTTTGYARAYYVAQNTWLPFIRHILQSNEIYGSTGYLAKGSTFYEATKGVTRTWFDDSGTVVSTMMSDYLVSTTTVSLAADGDTTLYTVPANLRFVPTKAILIAGADAGTSQISIGQSGATTDFLPAQTLSNINAQYDVAILQPVPNATPAQTKSYAATTVIKATVSNNAGGATNTLLLFGYLY